MGISERKAREREAREKLILDVARRQLLKGGFQNLNLDQVASEIEYSKGTIYQHFASKEDLALAISTAALGERADLFERALSFEGRSRERARAIGFACCHFMRAYPEYFHVELMLKGASFWEKAAPERQAAHGQTGARVFHAVHQVVEEGVRAGDLKATRMSTAHVAFAMAAITMGSHIMSQEGALCQLACIDNDVDVVRQNQDVLLDGFGWRPLFGDYDYAATDRRIRAEIFPEAAWFVQDMTVAAAKDGQKAVGTIRKKGRQT